MNDQAKLDAAASFFSRTTGKGPLDLESIKHIEAVMEDILDRAFKSMIIAGKLHIQASAGEDAAVDLYSKGKKIAMTVLQAQTFTSMLFSTLKTGKEPTKSDLEYLICELLLRAMTDHEELCKLGSSITHLKGR